MATRISVVTQACRNQAVKLLLVATMLFPLPVWAQDAPPESVPPDAEREIADLEAVVYELTFVTEDTYRVTETAQTVLIELAADVLFDFDKADIKASAIAPLQRCAASILGSARGDVRIEGHTDSKGPSDYNQTLSEQRAEAIRAWLTAEGNLTDIQFVTRGFGETQPAVPNENEHGGDDPLGRQRNRRVEIIITTVS
jgi:outer membrane protein OmpA-like peptidoglycan-associated protein